MKEDKICLSKTVAFVAVVAFILVGVVVFTNYVNTQNVTNSSRASGLQDSVCSGTYGGSCVSDASCSDFATRMGGGTARTTYSAGPVDSCGTRGTLKCCIPQP